MLKKNLLIASLFATFLIAISPVDAVQRFLIDPNDLTGFTTANQKPIKYAPGRLEWNELQLDPIDSLDYPGRIEYIVANKKDHGPELIRGQRLTLTLQRSWQESRWEEMDCPDQCLAGCCLVCLPCLACMIFTQKPQSDVMKALGQIEFSTDQQPMAVLLKLSKTSDSVLVASPFEAK